MGTWKSHGLRGSVFENQINDTNMKYQAGKLALVQKIPTPITPLELNGHGQITKAFFDSKSTVDYIGAVQGIPVCFDAKECKDLTFPIKNIHDHQVQFMQEFEQQGGLAFLLINFLAVSDTCYYFLPLEMLMPFWNRAKEGGKKSFRFEELDPSWVLPRKEGIMVPYLDGIQKYLNLKAEKEKKNAG